MSQNCWEAIQAPTDDTNNGNKQEGASKKAQYLDPKNFKKCQLTQVGGRGKKTFFGAAGEIFQKGGRGKLPKGRPGKITKRAAGEKKGHSDDSSPNPEANFELDRFEFLLAHSSPLTPH